MWDCCNQRVIIFPESSNHLWCGQGAHGSRFLHAARMQLKHTRCKQAHLLHLSWEPSIAFPSAVHEYAHQCQHLRSTYRKGDVRVDCLSTRDIWIMILAGRNSFLADTHLHDAQVSVARPGLLVMLCWTAGGNPATPGAASAAACPRHMRGATPAALYDSRYQSCKHLPTLPPVTLFRAGCHGAEVSWGCTAAVACVPTLQ